MMESFIMSDPNIRSGERAVAPDEIDDDCAEARASLAICSARLFDGERRVTVPPGHGAWVAEQLRAAGWLVDAGTAPDGYAVLVVTRSP